MNGPEDCEVWPGDGIDGWDCVDEASWESFPASDPPSFHVLRIGPPVAARKDLRSRRARRRRESHRSEIRR
jgi:hypothetical protein